MQKQGRHVGVKHMNDHRRTVTSDGVVKVKEGGRKSSLAQFGSMVRTADERLESNSWGNFRPTALLNQAWTHGPMHLERHRN